jgi:hypothetical protein
LNERRAGRRDMWLAAFLLLVLIAAVHRDVVFRGKSLVHTNYSNPFDYRPLPQNYGENPVPHDKWTERNLWPFPNIRDPGAVWWQWEPSTEFLKQSIARQEWPFWDPFVACGTPAMANLIPAFFFPPYTIVAALGAPVHLKNAYFLFLLWAAAFLTFLFLARHRLSFLASLFGAAIVAMGGSMTQNLGSFAGQTVACLPLTLYGTRLLLDRPSGPRAAALAATYGIAALASFPPVLVGVFGITAIYALVAIAGGDCPQGRVSAAVHWTMAVALSLGLVGFCYVPTLALREAVPHVAATYRGAGLETMPLVNLYQLLSPTLMGGVQVYWQAPFASQGQGPHIPYVGMPCLICVLLARPAPGRSSRTLFVASAVSASAILLKLFGAPPSQWIGYLPFLNQIHFAHYLGVPLGFLMAFLAAQGLHAVLRRSVSPTRIVVTAVLAMISVECLWWLAERTTGFKKTVATYWIQDWKVLSAGTVISAVAILVTAYEGAGRRTLAAAALVLLALVAGEGAYNSTYPRPRAWNLFDHPVPYVRLLQKDASMTRVFALGTPPANSNEAFRVFVFDSLMAFNAPRVFQLYRRYASPPPGVFMNQASVIPPEPVLDRANVGFVGSYNAQTHFVREAEGRGYRRRFDDGFVTIFERTTPPRFWFSSEYRVVPATAALEAVGSMPAREREILLEEPPGFAAAPNATGDPDVRVEHYGNNAISLVVDAPRPGLVYASESFFDGWTASVNGKEMRVLPANYAFRAVVVPAGRSRVDLRYWPAGLSAGLALSSASAAVCLACALIPGRRFRRAAPRKPEA